MPMNAHYHDFLCEWRCYFGQQVAPKDTIIFIAQRVRDVTAPGGTWVFCGWICAARDSKLAPLLKNISPKFDTLF